MAVLAECPICRRRQSLRNKVCKCGENLDKAKKAGGLNIGSPIVSPEENSALRRSQVKNLPILNLQKMSKVKGGFKKEKRDSSRFCLRQGLLLKS